jgi:hypothetical protein
VLSGSHPGRASADEITVYKSMGHAVEDAAAAALVLRLNSSDPDAELLWRPQLAAAGFAFDREAELKAGATDRALRAGSPPHTAGRPPAARPRTPQ